MYRRYGPVASCFRPSDEAMETLDRTASKPIRELEEEPGRRELDARLNDKLMKREREREGESQTVSCRTKMLSETPDRAGGVVQS